MTSLLKVTSLTQETDSKAAASCASRHLGPVWHFACMELATSILFLTTFCLPPGQLYAEFLQTLSTFWGPCPWVWALSWHEQRAGEVAPVRRLGWGPSVCRAKCERLARSRGGTVLAGIFKFRSPFTQWASNKKPRRQIWNFGICLFSLSWPLLYHCFLPGKSSVYILFTFYPDAYIHFCVLYYRVSEAPVLVGSSNAARPLRRCLFLFQRHVSPSSAPPVLR